MVKRGAEILDVRTSIRALARFEQRRERKENLSDREKENRRSPEYSWQKA
jgi:hypothetical protein